jgi:hypothetical protein
VSWSNTHAHPASILAHVVDAIRSDPSQLENDEVMYPHLLRVSLEPKLSAPVFEVSTNSFFLVSTEMTG